MTKIEKLGLEGVVLELKASGFSYEAISKKLKDNHNIDVSPPSVHRYILKRKSPKAKKKQDKQHSGPIEDKPILCINLPSSNDPSEILDDVFLKTVKLIHGKMTNAVAGACPLPRKEVDLADKLASIISKRAAAAKNEAQEKDINIRVIREGEKEEPEKQSFKVNGKNIFF